MSLPDAVDGYGPLRSQKKGFFKLAWDRVIVLDRLPDDAQYPRRVWSFYGVSLGRWFSLGMTLGRKGRSTSMAAYTYSIDGQTVERYAIELLPTALTLHQMATGSMDIDLDQANTAMAQLEARLNDWSPSTASTEAFDTHVHRLCVTAIQEWRAYCKHGKQP